MFLVHTFLILIVSGFIHFYLIDSGFMLRHAAFCMSKKGLYPGSLQVLKANGYAFKEITINTELNDLRKIFLLRKSKVYVLKKNQFFMSLKNCWSIADPVSARLLYK